MRLAIGLACLLFTAPAFAQSSTYVKPHVRSDGTYVQGHYRTNPDNNVYNNYSTKPNVNPYTGKQGTVDPYGSRSNVFGSNTKSKSNIWGDDD